MPMWTLMKRQGLAVVVLVGAVLGALPAQAMEAGAFSQLSKRVQSAGLSETKITIVKTAASTNTFTCAQSAQILATLPFADDKLLALQALQGRIEDLPNKAAILQSFSADGDRAKAEQLLASSASVKAAGGAAPPAVASGVIPLVVNQVGAWPDKDVDSLVAALQKESFAAGKMKVLTAAMEGRPEGFSSAQIQRIVPVLSFSDDMVKALQLLDGRLLGMTSAEVLGVLGKYSFSDDKLKVLKALKDSIVDAENKFVILDGFTMSGDKEKARKILETVKRRSPVYGTVRSQRVTFIVDVSGSMEASFTTSQNEKMNRLRFVQRELTAVLREALPDGAKFNVIPFSTGVSPWKPQLVPASPQAVQEAVTLVAGLRPNGGTNIYGALEKALADPEVDTLYFLTDGMPTAGKKTDNATILKDVMSWRGKRPVAVNTIAFLMGNDASDDKPKARALMFELAKATSGIARAIE